MDKTAALKQLMDASIEGGWNLMAEGVAAKVSELERQLAESRSEISDYRAGTGMKRSEIIRVLGDPTKGVTITSIAIPRESEP